MIRNEIHMKYEIKTCCNDGCNSSPAGEHGPQDTFNFPLPCHPLTNCTFFGLGSAMFPRQRPKTMPWWGSVAFFNGLKNNHTLAQLVMELNPIGVVGAIGGDCDMQFTLKDYVGLWALGVDVHLIGDLDRFEIWTDLEYLARYCAEWVAKGRRQLWAWRTFHTLDGTIGIQESYHSLSAATPIWSDWWFHFLLFPFNLGPDLMMTPQNDWWARAILIILMDYYSFIIYL